MLYLGSCNLIYLHGSNSLLHRLDSSLLQPTIIMSSYVITGCTRGLGLAMAEHLATFPSSEVDRIFATGRGESTALKALTQSSAGKVQFIRMDSSKEISIKAAVAEVDRILEGQGLDVLVNNAGQSFTLNSTITMYAPPFCKTIRNI